MTGRNMVNAINMKKTPAARSIPKYMRDFPEGILLVADWKFPGKSRTPFETLRESILKIIISPRTSFYPVMALGNLPRVAAYRSKIKIKTESSKKV